MPAKIRDEFKTETQLLKLLNLELPFLENRARAHEHGNAQDIQKLKLNLPIH